jgi:hypothetical protein
VGAESTDKVFFIGEPLTGIGVDEKRVSRKRYAVLGLIIGLKNAIKTHNTALA